MASTQKVIGSPLQNLVLETAGRVYIKVAEHYYELDFRNKTVEEVSEEESNPGEDSTPVNIDLSQYINTSYLNKVLSGYATKDIVNNLLDLITDIQNNIEIPIFNDKIIYNQSSYVKPSIQTKYSFITSLLNGTEVSPNFQIIDGDLVCPPTVVKHSGINPPTVNQPNLNIKYYSRWNINNGISDANSGLNITTITDPTVYEETVEVGSLLCHLESKEPVNVYLRIPKFTYNEANFDQADSYENRTGAYTKVGPEGSYLFTYSTYDFEDDNNYYLLAAKVLANGDNYDIVTYNYDHVVNAGDLNISQFKSNNYNILLDLDAGTLKLGNKLIYENGVLDIDVPYFENRYQKSITVPSLTPTDLNPSGWTTSIPTYSEGDIIWMISCQRTKTALVTNWSGPVRITSPNIDASIMRYIGRSTTAITDGGTELPTINGQVISTLKLGDVVAYNAKEFVWIGSCWEELGDENSYLPKSGGTITGDLTVNGVFEAIGAMIIPDHAPANPTSGKNYLYSATGEYAEEPSGGGGVAVIYDLTVKKNSVLIGTYNLGTAAAEVNIPITWTDLVEDSSHQFVSATEKQTWNAKYDLPSGGIPKTDLASAVQTSLDKADTAVQPGSIKKLTLQKNNETAVEYNPLASGNTTFRFTVPTTVAELSDAADYVTDTELSTILTGYVTLATDQTITGKKIIGNLSVTSSLAIPQAAPSNPDNNLKYLYVGTGEYAEEPSGGGGVANIYDLTISKNSAEIGTYNLGTAAANVNILISWSDLVPDATHQFVTSSDITNWNLAFSNTHTHDNKTVLDGITSTKVTNWDTAYSQTHTHDNKSVLDGIDAGDITNWDTAYGWGDHSTQGYTNINQSIPYIVGSSSDTTGYWTGSYTGITAYTDGLTVIYVPGKDGRSGGSYLNINGLGSIPCYYTASSKITTQYAVGVPILLTYRTYDGAGRWMRADYDSNTNTLVRVYRQTTGYNDDYPIIVSRTKNIGTAGEDASYTAVYGVVHDTTQQPTVNPSTGEIKAAKFTGDVAWSNISSTPTTLVGYGITDGINEIATSGAGNAVTGASISGHVLTIAKENTFVDLTSAQTITGAKKLKNVALLNIPSSAPDVADIEAGKLYLYVGAGDYSEIPSGGGGSATVYDLTLRKNQAIIGTYNLGTAAADVNIPIAWTDLTEDANHQFVTSTEKTTWGNKLDSISGSSTGMTVPYISGVTKNGTTLEFTYSDMPTYIVNDGEFSLNAKIGSTTSEVADFTANQVTNDDITFEQGNYITFDITGTRTLKISGNYSAGTKALFDTGTDTTIRVWSASVLKSTVAPIVHTHTVRSGLKSDGTTYITSTTDANNNITLGEVLASAGSYGDSSAQTPAYGATFKVPYITVNKQGIVTAISEHTVKIPASDNTARLQVGSTADKKINTLENTSNYIQFTSGTNSFKVGDGTNEFTVDVTPSITNNVTYSGTPTAGQLTVWDSAGVIKNSGYTVGSSGTLFSAFTGGGITSSGNTLAQADHSITIGGKTLTAGSSTATIINSITSSASSDATTNLSGTVTVNSQSTTFTVSNIYARYIQVSVRSDNADQYIIFGPNAQTDTGQSLYKNSSLKYNPGTSTLTGVNSTFTGTGTFSGTLYIPAHTPGASSTDIAALYLGTGDYSEVPSGGGGSATVYDLTVQKNSADIGTYNLGTAAATVNITIGWTDLTEDSNHQFVTATNKANWNDAYDKRHTHDNKTVLDGITSGKVSNWDTAYGWGDHSQAGYLTSTSLDGYVNDLEQTSGNYVTSITKSGKKITVTRATLPTTIDLANVNNADDLKAIEALTGTSGYLKKTAANTWALDTTIAAAAYKAVDSSISSTTSTNLPTSAAVAAYVSTALTSVLKYKGTVGTGGTVTTLPANHQVGDCYVVKTAGTYAGKACEVGDYIICNTAGTTATDSHWDVVNGENQVENKNASLANAGSSVTIATVDGTDLTITTPSTWTGVTKVGTITKVGNTSSGDVTVSSSNNTASFNSAVTVGTVGGVDLKFTMPQIYALTINNSAGTTQLTYNPSTSTDNSITLTKAMVGLSNVENTALSTWTGSSNITTLGTITTGTWNGTKIANAYLVNNSVTVGNATIALGGSATLTQIGVPTWAQASSKPSYTPAEIFGSSSIGDSTTPVYYNGTNLTTTTLANKYVTLDTEQTISGEKYFSTKLAIPTIAPTSPITGRHYLYFDLSGNYSETPSGGGGSGTIYDLTVQKNSVDIGTYNLGTSDATVNILIGWSDLTEDASHKFVSQTEKNTWNNKIDSSALTGYVNALSGTAGSNQYVSSITKSGSTITVSYSNLPSAYTLPLATTTVRGGVKIYNTVSSVITAATGSTADRYYGVQIGSDEKLFVNIPWENTHNSHGHTFTTTTPSSATNLSFGSEFNVVTALGNAAATTGSLTSTYTTVKYKLPTESTLSKTDSGDGNAVTAISVSGHAITVTKGSTFALASELAGYVLKTGDTMTGSLTMSGESTNIRINSGTEYFGTASGSQCHVQYDDTNKCLNFIFD